MVKVQYNGDDRWYRISKMGGTDCLDYEVSAIDGFVEGGTPVVIR